MARTLQASCKFTVYGMSMDCPVCNAHVESGESHECHRKGDEYAGITVPAIDALTAISSALKPIRERKKGGGA